ncbi:zinc-binding alcohol dehydrogenase family protein [Microbacterium sp. SA39]|uniref:zinc-binding alcohol dehydrogenase family protein n=1 Tax=Microbacterium sp. SA39 TaxID=1263625 RepID=UPI00061FB2B7|nr:zinc-binding alcohol dehydrogenase family protein [Microbacterium sp. SA39]KJQ55124.1 Zinc-type alcohol dehydrogenase-like protein [Microbacterium sp. SA39]
MAHDITSLPELMPAIGARGGRPVSDPESLTDLSLPVPTPEGRDLLVEVEGVSINPVDVKVRAGSPTSGERRIVGYDAVGTVVGLGDQASRFAVGDRVFYAGQIDRPGTNSRYHLVNENIVGHAPRSLSTAGAAALPLTAITAWEALFDKLRLDDRSEGTLLVIGAAGGVGSLIIQLAKALTKLTVIAVASRKESADWVLQMGADHVVGRDFAAEVSALAPKGVDYVFTSFTPGNVRAIAQVIRPRGEVVSIDETGGSIDALKAKSVTWHWELMFTRPVTDPTDHYQHELLEQFAELIDDGVIRTTMTQHLTPLDAATMRQAHEIVEASQTIGKVVVTDWAAAEQPAS